MPTVCYLILTHRDPPQVERLVRTLRRGSPAAPIVVTHDARACELDRARVADLSAVFVRSSTRAYVRGWWSGHMQTYLESIAWIERQGIEYDWLVDLTGQDYPVKPLPVAEAFLAASSADAYLRVWDVLSPASPWSRRKARARYWYRYTPLPESLAPLLRALRPLAKLLPFQVYLDYGTFFGVRRLRTPFGPDFRCYGGWSFLTLRRAAARYLLEFAAARPDIVRYYQRTMVPDESFVQTALQNSGRFRLVDDDLRYIDYRHAVRGAPRVLTTADLPQLASGKYHLARKFDPAVDAEVLDRVDRELLLSS